VRHPKEINTQTLFDKIYEASTRTFCYICQAEAVCVSLCHY